MAIQAPPPPVAFEKYRKRFKRHLDLNELKEVGVSSQDYFFESFRLGGLSVMGADKIITPVFSLYNSKCFFFLMFEALFR